MPRPHPCLAPPPAPIAPHHLSTAPLPPAPIGLASSASRPSRAVARIASTPLRAAIRIPLCRHRADPALIAPHRAHRAPPHAFPSRVASAPRPWLARIAPHASPFSRMREKGPLPGSIRPKCMLFEIKMATSSPHASVSGRNRAIRDTWRANLAAKGPFSRRGARNHAWREDVASAARPFRGSGMRSGGTGFAPCDSGMRHAAWPNGLCALRRGPGLLAACAPPAISLVPAAACAPCHLPAFIAAVLHASRFAARIVSTAPPSAASPIAVGVSRLSGSSRRPRAVHADASRPPMRARRHRPSPNPSQPGPGPEPAESRPPVEPSAPTRAPPPAAPHPAARVPLRFS